MLWGFFPEVQTRYDDPWNLSLIQSKNEQSGNVGMQRQYGIVINLGGVVSPCGQSINLLFVEIQAGYKILSLLAQENREQIYFKNIKIVVNKNWHFLSASVRMVYKVMDHGSWHDKMTGFLYITIIKALCNYISVADRLLEVICVCFRNTVSF